MAGWADVAQPAMLRIEPVWAKLAELLGEWLRPVARLRGATTELLYPAVDRLRPVLHRLRPTIAAAQRRVQQPGTALPVAAAGRRHRRHRGGRVRGRLRPHRAAAHDHLPGAADHVERRERLRQRRARAHRRRHRNTHAARQAAGSTSTGPRRRRRPAARRHRPRRAARGRVPGAHQHADPAQPDHDTDAEPDDRPRRHRHRAPSSTSGSISPSPTSGRGLGDRLSSCSDDAVTGHPKQASRPSPTPTSCPARPRQLTGPADPRLACPRSPSSAPRGLAACRASGPAAGRRRAAAAAATAPAEDVRRTVGPSRAGTAPAAASAAGLGGARPRPPARRSPRCRRAGGQPRCCSAASGASGSSRIASAAAGDPPRDVRRALRAGAPRGSTARRDCLAASRAVARQRASALPARSPRHRATQRSACHGTMASTPTSVMISTASSPAVALGDRLHDHDPGLGAPARCGGPARPAPPRPAGPRRHHALGHRARAVGQVDPLADRRAAARSWRAGPRPGRARSASPLRARRSRPGRPAVSGRVPGVSGR